LQRNKINLAELTSAQGLWEICDALSAAHSGLPDSLLKDAMLNLLENQYQIFGKNHWIRQHLDGLIKYGLKFI
jgi:hypothetical protein